MFLLAKKKNPLIYLGNRKDFNKSSILIMKETIKPFNLHAALSFFIWMEYTFIDRIGPTGTMHTGRKHLHQLSDKKIQIIEYDLKTVCINKKKCSPDLYPM